MTDISQLSQVVTQLSAMGSDLSKILTPYALLAAKLSAIQGWYGNVAAMFVIPFFISLVLGIWIGLQEKDFFSFIFSFCVLGIGLFPIFIGLNFLIGNPIVNYYGMHHPDVFLAYEALQKVTGN